MCFYTRYVICDGFSDGEKLIIPIWIEGLGSNLCCLLPSDLLSSVLWPITLRVFVVAKIGVFVHILLFVLILGKLENLVVNQPNIFAYSLNERCKVRNTIGDLVIETKHFSNLKLLTFWLKRHLTLIVSCDSTGNGFFKLLTNAD